MKKTTIFRVIVFMLILLNFGCVSNYPITTKPSGEIEKELLGTWYFADTSAEVIYYNYSIELVEWSNAEYLAILTHSLEDGTLSGVGHSKVYKSTVNGIDYFNAINFKGYDKKASIFKVKLIDSISLEINVITDSLKLQFKSSDALYQYISQNQDEFESYLSEKWMSWQRVEYWTWDKSNIKWKDEIKAVYQLKNRMRIDAFRHWNVKENIDSVEYEVLGKEEVLAQFNNYYQAPSREGSWKIRPKCLILVMKNGEHIKYLWNDRRLEDVTNKHAYYILR